VPAPLQIALNRPPTTLVAQPSWLASPFFLLIRASLVLALGAGFSLGVYLVLGFAFGLPLAASTPALMQVHGQVQVFGFVALFIMAVAVQLFPRFHASKLEHPRQVSLGGVLLAAGVTVRLISQPLTPGGVVRPILLVLSGVLELVGVLLAVHAFARVIRGGVQPAPRGWAALLPMTMGGSLLLALALNLIGCIGLAQGGLVVPFAQDEALLHLEIWGFASTMVLAVSGRVFPRFLLLQPTRDRLLRPALGLWALGSFGVPLVWLFMDGAGPARLVATLAQLTGAILYVVSLRLYEWPIRESGTPWVTNPTRRWARSAFGLLLAAAAANVGIAAAETLGLRVTLTELSAGRHLVAQGFLLPLIVLMAARILPGYSGQMLHRPRLLAALGWSLLMGAAVRGGAELVAGYASGWGSAVALGGVIGAVAFVVFAVGLWRAVPRVEAIGTA
jgi:uncharacterized protein involved in response to NO